MFIKKKFSVKNMVSWTRWETLLFICISLFVTVLFEFFGWKWMQLPWTPIALIGTAVAFLIGFQSSAAYDRIWEARKIWGGIVNTSRTWTMMVKDTVTNEYAKKPESDEELKGEIKTLVYRQIAWLSTLRHAMRQKRPWEVFGEHRTNREWESMIFIPERKKTLKEDLEGLLRKDEIDEVLSKTNKSAAILILQSAHIRRLKEKGLIWEFSFLELEGLLKELFDLQGKSERIKNFPYPRQFATLGYDFVKIFVYLLPFGTVPEFSRIGLSLVETYPVFSQYFVWLAVPFTAIVSWVFHTMQRIGTVGENPFEGSANDVPISTMSRGIEIDLREMLGEEKSMIPEPLEANYGVQM